MTTRNIYLGNQYGLILKEKSTSSGFKHIVTLIGVGEVIMTRETSWSNRTWESFPYENTIRDVLSFFNNKQEEARLLKICEDRLA